MVIFLQRKYILTFVIIFSAAFIIDYANLEEKINYLSEYVKKNDVNLTFADLKNYLNMSNLNNIINISDHSFCSIKPDCLCDDGTPVCFGI